MKLKCKTIDGNNGSSEYEYLTIGKKYEATLAHSSVKFSEEEKRHFHNSVFLVYNDSNKWREYPSYLFEPI